MTAASGPGSTDPAAGLVFRRPVEADHARVVAVIDDWWDGRRMRHLLPRLWLQHFTGTSWIAETADGRLAGFLVGFVSPDHPDTGYVHMVAARPGLRRRGVARSLYARFIDDIQVRGVHCVVAITWPGNRPSLAFHRALGFSVPEGEGTTRVYGTPAIVDYEADGSDTSVMELDLARRYHAALRAPLDGGPEPAAPQTKATGAR